VAPANLLRRLTPPVLWDLLRRARGKPPLRSYHGVTTPFDMSALHQGRFAAVFDAVYRNDPGLRHDANLLRLRAYCAHMFAAIAMRAPGDFLEAGVSYGVIAKVLYELTVKESGRTYHLVDVDPRHTEAKREYCSDPAFVPALFRDDPAVRLHLVGIPAVFPLPLPTGLAFAHLDTDNEDVEFASLPYLVENLNPGGVILIEAYGLQPFAARYDAVARQLQASIFTLPSGQGVLIKR